MHDFISVIIPSYNKGSFIEETLKSVLNQSHKNFEIIVVDDGSTDNSLNTIKAMAEANGNVRCFNRTTEPKGASSCRNIGLNHAKGNYILFLDSDDLIGAQCLQNRLEFISKEKCDFAVFNTSTFYKNVGDSNLHWTVPKGNYLKLFLSHDLPWNISSVLWKAEALRSMEGFNTSFERLQDVELHTKALLHNLNFRINRKNAPDFFYRIDANRNTHDNTESFRRKSEGVLTYLTYFKSEIIDLGKPQLLNYLKGTYISFLRDLLQEKVNDNNSIEPLFQKMISASSSYSLMEKLWLKIYIFLFKLGFYKIKGFNFGMKKIFILL